MTPSKITSLSLPVLYEDATCLVVQKPALLHSVDLPTGGGASLASALVQASESFSLASPKPEDGGLVHRLDFETSGAVIVAKTREAWEHLSSQLMSGLITKEYLAVVEGEAPRTKLITSWIGSKGRTSNKVRVFLEKPREAYRVLQGSSEFILKKFDKPLNASLVLVRASPARRHQVRAHAAFLGFPLYGDEKYGSTKKWSSSEIPPFILHSASVTFKSPLTEKLISVNCPLPERLSSVIGSLA